MPSLLSQKALLADLSIGKFSGRKSDKTVAEFALGEFHAAKDAGSFSKQLLPATALAEVNAAVSKMFQYHRENTLPWGAKSVRLLPSVKFLDYKRTINEYTQQFNQAVEKLVAAYDKTVEQQKVRLGQMFSITDYPLVEDFKNKFKVVLVIEPVPETGDFRVDVGDEMLEQLKNDLEEAQNERLKLVSKDIFDRFYKELVAMRDKLEDPKAIFRNTLSDSLVKLVKMLPALNITDDPELNKLGMDVIQDVLTKTTDPDKIRCNPNLRSEVVRDADKIIANMAPMFA